MLAALYGDSTRTWHVLSQRRCPVHGRPEQAPHSPPGCEETHAQRLRPQPPQQCRTSGRSWQISLGEASERAIDRASKEPASSVVIVSASAAVRRGTSIGTNVWDLASSVWQLGPEECCNRTVGRVERASSAHQYRINTAFGHNTHGQERYKTLLGETVNNREGEGPIREETLLNSNRNHGSAWHFLRASV